MSLLISSKATTRHITVHILQSSEKLLTLISQLGVHSTAKYNYKQGQGNLHTVKTAARRGCLETEIFFEDKIGHQLDP
jgi:hypothetical protein